VQEHDRIYIFRKLSPKKEGNNEEESKSARRGNIMAESKYGRYLVTELKAPETTPEAAANYAEFAKRVLRINENVVKGGNVMKRRAMKFFIAGGILAVVVCATAVVSWSAEKYPSRSVEIANGSGAGGGQDLEGRIWAKYLEKYLKVPFFTINKPGPSNMMGASYVAKAKPDGYTIGFLGSPIITAELTGQASGYRLNELRPICQIATNGVTVAVPADSPWKTFQDFMDYAKKNPGLKYGHPGVGSGPSQNMELLNKFAKLSMIGVPFKGEGEVLPALLGKHIAIAPLSPAIAKVQAQAGTIRILASFIKPTQVRLDPSIPCLADMYKDMPSVPSFMFLWAPIGTPDDIIRTIENAVVQIIKDPQFQADAERNNIHPLYVDGDTLVKKDMAEKIKIYMTALEVLGQIKK
jgi:tripartite-type tricarboxylate transporter receptor subunit TctC